MLLFTVVTGEPEDPKTTAAAAAAVMMVQMIGIKWTHPPVFSRKVAGISAGVASTYV